MGGQRYGNYYGNERERSYRATNFDFYDPWQTEGNYQMPIVRRCDVVPERLLGFNYAKCEKENAECGIHFFIDDYQFERIWSNPRQTIPRLARFRCVLTPDFSLYLDMPMAMKIWNTYRSRMIGQMMQREGLRFLGWQLAEGLLYRHGFFQRFLKSVEPPNFQAVVSCLGEVNFGEHLVQSFVRPQHCF